jgi:hypothetical protein
MEKRITFLHLTDSHLAGTGVPFRRDDLKTDVPGITAGTREASLELLLARLAERLAQDRQILGGVLFSGDAQHRNAPGGHERVIDMLLNHLGPLGC